ncbi:Short-chain dehydrogenase [Microbulbifer donghaiensis]|uniref:Short-chain dehydrogenase n=1 Tax=Microbulbifer donghaiensis TaxID=494016 RepID=A0A1M4ZK06_9GAMM|nr:oxidoreductase [Microbulbifer donghaiensis]SHF18308.1 Short-chain dehydrogenase [Microbulbifer donghaiensis]
MSKQVALVTGASSGMGKDFARALAKQGMVVYAAARRLENMRDLEAEGIIPLQMDITLSGDIEAVVAQIERDHGGVDLLINNAGFGMYGAVEDTSIDDARYQFEVNLFGLARLTQLVLPYMRKQRAGKIINISSVGGKVYTPLGAWYHATKHALEGWSDCLRIEVQKFGIDVVLIEPGIIATEFSDVMNGPMLERSDEGPYRDLANKIAQASKDTFEKGNCSSPSVITDLVMKAVRSRRPKTRYSGGKYAGTLLFIRKWFSDRLFDRAVMSLVK